MLAENASVEHVAENVFAADSTNAQFNQTVAEKDAGAGAELASKIRECRGNAGGIPGNVFRSDGDNRAGLENDVLVALQGTGANLGTLQILEDTDGASFALGCAAEAMNVVGVVFVRAVREVQAGNVHAEAHQLAHHGFVVAGRTDRADDLGAAPGGGRDTCSGGRLCLFQFVPRLKRYIGKLQQNPGIEPLIASIAG